MRETGKKREELKASRPKRNIINEEDLKLKTDYNVSCGGFYSQPLIQNTKKKKAKAITGAKTRRKPKKRNKEVKKSKAGQVNSGAGKGNFRNL